MVKRNGLPRFASDLSVPRLLSGCAWVPSGCFLGASWVARGCLLGGSWVLPMYILGSPEWLLHVAWVPQVVEAHLLKGRHSQMALTLVVASW